MSRQLNFQHSASALIASSLLAALTIGCGGGTSSVSTPPAPGVLSFSSTSVTLATTSVGGIPTGANITVTNSGGTAEQVSGYAVSGANATDFTESNNCSSSINPGAGCVITIAYLPMGVGARAAMLSLVGNGTTSTIGLAATGTAGANMTAYSSVCPSPQVVCGQSIANAVVDAGTYLTVNPTLTYTLTVPAGSYDFSNETAGVVRSDTAIDFDGLFPTTGLFTFQGFGSALTTLTTPNLLTQFRGAKVSHLHIQGMTLRRHSMTVTQGTVTDASTPGQVTIQIPVGFPLETALIDPNDPTPGRYLRAYDNTDPLHPFISEDATNGQIAYSQTVNPTCAGQLCTFYFDKSTFVVPALYTQPNIVIGVKSEQSGQAYFFDNLNYTAGVDVGFNDIIWYDTARGVWRNFTGSFVTNSSIFKRAAINGQVPMMSTAAGGPQFGQPNDLEPMGGIVVNNFNAQSTGDDSLAIFNDTTNTSMLSNLTIDSGFARTVNLYKSCNVQLAPNITQNLTHCQPLVGSHDIPTTYNGCVTDTSPSPTACGPIL